jgi:putative ATP-binding cassette transporter
MSKKTDANEQIKRPAHFWRELWRIVASYLVSEDKLRAWALLIFGIALTVVYTYLVPLPAKALGDVVTALSEQNAELFWARLPRALILPLIVVAVVIFAQVFDALLALYWRRWLTLDFLRRYFSHRAFYHLTYNREIKNPDQRIQEDIAGFTSQFRGTITSVVLIPGTIISGSIALWALSPNLVIGLWIFGIINLVVSSTIFAKKLSWLNFNQLRREANFRTSLVRVRENAEAIAFYRGEAREIGYTERRLDEVYNIQNQVIRWNSVFFNGYIQLFSGKVPSILAYLIFVPLISAKSVAPGALTEALVNAGLVGGGWVGLSGLIDDFARVYASAVRVISLKQALDSASQAPAGADLIETVEKPQLKVSGLTLQTPDYERELFRDLDFQAPANKGILVVGESGIGKSSLLRAIAGLWRSGKGRIERPPLSEMLFLSQKPYMTLGSLRRQLLYPQPDREISEDTLRDALKRVNLGDLPEQVGGFDFEVDWSAYLSPGQQQRLAFARVLVNRSRFVVLDESTSALDVPNEARVYAELQKEGTTFLSVAHRPSVVEYHQNVLRLKGNGEWEMGTLDEYLKSEQKVEE